MYDNFRTRVGVVIDRAATIGYTEMVNAANALDSAVSNNEDGRYWLQMHCQMATEKAEAAMASGDMELAIATAKTADAYNRLYDTLYPS